MKKLIFFSILLFLSILGFAQTSLNLEIGVTQYEDRVDDSQGVYRNSRYFSKGFGVSIKHHLTERFSFEPGLLWRSYISATTAVLQAEDLMIGSSSQSHSSANQIFLRLNYNVLRVEDLTFSPSVGYHRAFDPKRSGGLEFESLEAGNLSFKSSKMLTGKSSYGVLDLGINIDSRLGKRVSLGGFYRHNFLSTNQSALVNYSLNERDGQALIFRESEYRYLGFNLSIQILKGDF